MRIDSVQTLLVEEMKDIYNAEKQITKALPKMIKKVKSADLKQALQDHLGETQNQVSRLEQAFELLDESVKGKPCAGMKGLLEEGDEMLQEDATDELFDAGVIGAARRVEHYEMAAYSSVIALAEKLEAGEVVDLLQETLDEETAADSKLAEICDTILAEVDAGGDEAEAGDEEASAQPPMKARTARRGGSAN